MNIFKFIQVAALTTIVVASQAALASDKLSSTVKEPNIFHFPGEQNVNVCDIDSNNKYSCEEFSMPARLGLVKKIIPGRFIKSAKGSWITLSEKMNGLCAIGYDNQITCTKIKIPVLAGIDIGYKDNLNGTPLITFSIKGAHTKDLNSIKKVSGAFVHVLADAQQKLTNNLANPQAQLADFEPTDCGEDACDGGIGGGGGGGGGEGPGDGGGGGDEGGAGDLPSDEGGYVEEPVPPIDVGDSPATEACKAACYAVYIGSDVPRCTRVPTAQGKAICYAGAAAKLGVCIAMC